MNWVTASILSLLSFGLWGFFTKIAMNYIDARSALIYQTLGVLIFSTLLFASMGFRSQFELKGLGFSILTGIAYSLGCLFYFIAASKGRIITVITLTALYPLITIILAYFILGETLSLKQISGIGLALLSILLLAT